MIRSFFIILALASFCFPSNLINAEIAVRDSLKVAYCTIYQDDEGKIKIKVEKRYLSPDELKAISAWVDKLSENKTTEPAITTPHFYGKPYIQLDQLETK